MRFLNNRTGQDYPASNRSKYLYIGLGIVVLISLVGFFMLRGSDRAPDTPGTEYYDEASGETVSDPEGKSPEKFGTAQTGIVYLGFSKLVDHGITMNQLDALKTAFTLYSRERQEKISEVSIFVNTIKRTPYDRDSADPTRSITFDVKINRKDTYNATLQYISIRSAQLILHQNGTEIYRSTMIDPDNYTDDGEEHGDFYLPPEER